MRAGDDCLFCDEGRESSGLVDIGLGPLEVLLKVGTAFGRCWRLGGGRRDDCIILDLSSRGAL